MDTRETNSAMSEEEAVKGRPGHPEESPRGFANFVIIAAILVIIGIVWYFVA